MPKIRNIIIFIVIGVVLVLIYIFFVRQSPSQASLVSSTSGATTDANGNTATVNSTDAGSVVPQSFLALLLNVKNINLDVTIFSDPAFTSLHDSSIVLVPDATTGRPNPFAQFGNDTGSIAGTTPTAPVPSTTSPTAPTTPTGSPAAIIKLVPSTANVAPAPN